MKQQQSIKDRIKNECFVGEYNTIHIENSTHSPYYQGLRDLEHEGLECVDTVLMGYTGGGGQPKKYTFLATFYLPENWTP